MPTEPVPKRLVKMFVSLEMGMEQGLPHDGISFGLQGVPPSPERGTVRGNHPGSSRHDAGTIVVKQVFEGGKLGPGPS